jgi:hypothetical protein
VLPRPRRLRGGAAWLTVRIGRDDPHSQARFFLDSQAELATLPDRLLEEPGTCRHEV